MSKGKKHSNRIRKKFFFNDDTFRKCRACNDIFQNLIIFRIGLVIKLRISNNFFFSLNFNSFLIRFSMAFFPFANP